MVTDDDIGIKVLYEPFPDAQDAGSAPSLEYDSSIFLEEPGLSALALYLIAGYLMVW